MKELSIEEKAKRYDEAYKKVAVRFGSNVADEIFLKESEDERMMNQLHSWMKEFGGAEEYTEKVYQWIKGLLEKQGEQKTADTDNKFIRMRETKPKDISEFLDRLTTVEQEFLWEHIAKIRELDKEEQKPTDKVEQKFKVGDWVACNNGSHHVFQVIERSWPDAKYRDINGTEIFLNVRTLDKQYHLWTIQDAKDGDIIAFYSEYRGNKMVQVGIIEKYMGKHGGCSNTFKIYVGVNWENNLQIGEYMGCSDIRPATKEQRDTLFARMKEACYDWDADNKELKKIELNLAWSEEDEEMIQALNACINETIKGGMNYISFDSKSILIGKVKNWLKSLKEKYTWKPSDEQMDALESATENCAYSEYQDCLKELIVELKKLKE